MDRFSAHIDRAWDLISKGEGIQALLAARQALGINGDSAEVHNLLGCIYAMDGDFGEALTCYRRAMDLDDDYIDPVLNAAELLLHSQEDADEAIRYCDRAREMVSLEEELVEVVLLETDALLNKGHVEGARRKLHEVGEPNGLNAVHSMLVGRSYYEIGDFEKSKRFINYAIEQEPTYTDAWYCRGLLLREEGCRIDAVAAFNSVLESDRNRPTVGWIKQIGSVEKLVDQAIQSLDENTRRMLNPTKIVVTSLPTREQICQEIDPRQTVYAEGIDLAHGCFERLWVFVKNFEHVRISPFTVVEDLAQIIQNEVLFSQGPF